MGLKERWPQIVSRVKASQIWTSMFRHDFSDTPKTRMARIFDNIWLHLHPVRIPRISARLTHTFCLGGLTFFFFIVLTVTGVLLMFYYRPTVEAAYNDMKDLEFAVTLGMFLRNLHRWSAHLMVFFVIGHMARVFLTASYKPPREFNWVVGVILLTLTLLLSFSGYLLPWDQLAIWAVTVGTNMAAATPLLGAEGPFTIANPDNDARFVTLGGHFVGQATLLRFYVLHCIALPLAAGAFMIVHFWRVHKDGFAVPESA
jgi:quinol-cytochrome oxidoreductase complex cytochrome b subunit